LPRLFSYLFHPLIMPTLGLLIILNSGTYLSLYDPAAKRAVLFVMALGTLVFPLMMLPILYYRSLVTSYKDASREERLIPQVIILVLYIITFVYFQRLPLNRVIHAYVLSAAVLLFLVDPAEPPFPPVHSFSRPGGNRRTGHCPDLLIRNPFAG
jgi:hypothetical protein